MTNALAHRGPDDWGYMALNPGEAVEKPASRTPPSSPNRVWLGHRRLSIIDLAGSHQPLRNENGTVWVVFNGEIYNYVELRNHLSKKGHIIRESGDTEVLVHLWEQYGEQMVKHLVGMFAFALYDTQNDVLFLARDRFGQKPLYYWKNGTVFAFASEIQGLWRLENFPSDNLDEIAACQYFRYGYIPGPRTIFRNVRSLLPGHYLVASKENLKIQQYWKPQVVGQKNACDLETLEALLDEATRIRLRSDVPLGAFLSGGIDSALVVSSMVRQSEKPVKTFTITTGKYWCDESKPARITSNRLGTNHHEFQVMPDLVDITGKLAAHFGQPFADYSSVPTYYVSRETRKHVTVALSGDGGDELFGGYERYIHHPWATMAGRIPYGPRFFLATLIWKYLHIGPLSSGLIGDFLVTAGDAAYKGENHSYTFHDYWQQRCFQPGFPSTMRQLNQNEIGRFTQLYNEAVSENPLERWLEVDQRMYLADDILTKVDISSMAVSLECRSPFLDHKFAEAVNRIPLSKKLYRGKSKVILRDLAERRLPSAICGLPKKGFTLPLAHWMRGDLKDWSHDMIFQNQSSWDAFLCPKTVGLLWEEHQNGWYDHSKRLWIVIAWTMWANVLARSKYDTR